MRPLKTKVSITLDNDLVINLKEMAENDDRSFSQYINLILKDWVLLASGDISHLLSGENDQSQSDRNNQCISFSFL